MSPTPSPIVRALQFTGALLFVAALGAVAVAYVVRFASVTPAAPTPGRSVVWNALTFTVFALHHSVLARSPLKQWLHVRVGPELERTLYVVIASLLLLGCVLTWQPLAGTWWTWPRGWHWIGLAVQLAGVVVTLVAARAIDIGELAGLKAPARLPVPDDGPSDLETRGVYGIVRHPIYFGWVLMMAGAPVMTSSRLLFATVSIAYLAVAIPLEERSLVATFGQPYRDYQRRVRWRMVPGVY